MNESLQTALTRLRLSGLSSTLDVRLQEAAGHQLSHLEFLELLLQDELLVRNQRLIDRRTKAAGFRELRTLDDFDFAFNTSIKRKQIFDLATGRFIDNDLHVLKVHLPYHESDHVLNIAYNILAGGSCLEDLELLRNDEVYLDALGTGRIPDPTTAGDFCRRFTCDAQVVGLMETINRVRTNVWRLQPESFRELAILDADGTTCGRSAE